jgi:hypothetical protein
LTGLGDRVASAETIVQSFRESPLANVELDLERDKDPGREIEL